MASAWCSVFLYLLILYNADIVSGHIPMRYYNWAEPDVAEGPANLSPDIIRVNKAQSLEKVTALRQVMEQEGVDAYVVPTADAHNSQYIAASDARREWISGLAGSSGTAMVTADYALLWTDGRYFTQFYIQVNTDVWELMRQGTDASIQSWLASNLTAGAVVAIDPTTYTRTAWSSLETTLNAANITLLPILDNLVDRARENFGDPAPARPNEPLIPLTVDYTGRASSAKVSELLTQMNDRGAQVLVLTALDDIAYTLNLRGADIPYNPVFFSYLIIRSGVDSPNIVNLFWADGTLSTEITQHLTAEGTFVTTRPYNETFTYLTQLAYSLPSGSRIWLPQDGSHALHLLAEVNPSVQTLSTVSPVALMKCVKNQVELNGFRSSHIKDGIAVVRFLRWVHERVDEGRNVSEMDVSDKLEEFRSEEEDFMGPSFATIAGAGENGAIIHYKPSREGPQRLVTKDDVLLVDSGGQYRDGTTDITRTRHMSGSPTPEQRLTFTRVMKGQILMGTVVFPRGSTGNIIETLARKSLWDVGLNYNHGTGHGVGHFLNVHEGPSGIGSALSSTDPGIVPGMIFSNEPGYYEVDEYGIRHEDIVEVIEINSNSDHILASGMVGDFDGRGAVGFYTISLAPHQTACLDLDLLNEFEIKYINDYHARVLSTLGPILQERNLMEDYEWLEKECAPIRSAAILVVSAPILTIVSVISLWLRI